MWMSFAGIRINKWEDNKMETMDDYKDELEASFRRINVFVEKCQKEK